MPAVGLTMIVLITGPVRSGKSTRAASVARAFGVSVTHIVTARIDPSDAEMHDRIARHRNERGADATVELWQPDGLDLGALIAAAPPQSTLVVDSLGTWVAGQLLDLEELCETDALAALGQLEMLSDPLIAELATVRANVVIVAEETGWGIVPTSAQGRIFRDHLGRLTQRIGRSAQRVELVVAGFALDVKRLGLAV